MSRLASRGWRKRRKTARGHSPPWCHSWVGRGSQGFGVLAQQLAGGPLGRGQRRILAVNKQIAILEEEMTAAPQGPRGTPGSRASWGRVERKRPTSPRWTRRLPDGPPRRDTRRAHAAHAHGRRAPAPGGPAGSAGTQPAGRHPPRRGRGHDCPTPGPLPGGLYHHYEAARRHCAPGTGSGRGAAPGAHARKDRHPRPGTNGAPGYLGQSHGATHQHRSQEPGRAGPEKATGGRQGARRGGHCQLPEARRGRRGVAGAAGQSSGPIPR